MYQYSKTTPGRKPGKSSYFWPFIIIALSVGIIWAGWSLINRLWLGGQMETSQAQAQLSIDSGSVKAMTSGDETWTSVPNGIKLYEGEKVKVGPDGQASLLFSPEIEVRLSRSSEVALTELKQKDDRYDVAVELAKGSAWASLKNLAPSDSSFQIKTEFLNITGDSAKFAVTAPGTVYMIEGEASIEINEGEEALKSVTLRVGQQIIVDEKVIAALKTGSSEDLISELDETFKRSIFYIWNAQEEGWSTVMDEAKEESDDSESSEEKDKTEESSDTVKEDEKASTPEATKEEKEEDKKEETTVTGKVEITSPSKETQYESKTFDFDLKATVPSNTAKVTINGSYTLSQYKAGNTTAVYYVREKNANVKEGSNIYTVTAYDKEDKKIGEDSITVKVTATPTTTSPSTTPGTVSIVAPSSNATYESPTTDFALKASVPSNTVKVVVNDYTLGQYTAGSTTATYNVKKSNGNVKEGLNSYKVTAYDDKGSVIGSDTIEVTVKASATSTPASTPTTSTPPASTDGLSFTYPVASGAPAYPTSLNPLPVGGTVGSKYRWVYVNDVALDSHSLGNTTWAKSVELKPGLNTIKIMAEDEQHNTTSVKTITVDYQAQ